MASQYKDILEKITWSYSAVTSYHHCKYEFYLGRIVNDDDLYLKEGNFYAENGSLCHEILERYFKGELKIENAAKEYLKRFKKEIFYKIKPKKMNKVKKECAEYFSEHDFSWIDDYDILGVEYKCQFKLFGYNFVGYIDLLLRNKKTGKIEIIDHKSAKYPLKKDGGVLKSEAEQFDKYKKQMYLYSYAVWLEFGEYPDKITWNHFKDGGKFVTIDFDKNEYNETIRWFAETVKEVMNENDFKPSPNYFYCNNLCSFRHSCEHAKEGK